MSETDGIEEAFEGQFRVLMSAAAQVGERVARGREASLRNAQSHNQQEARHLQSRFVAEREVARVQLKRVNDPQWWDQAKPEDISAAWKTAKAWSSAEEPGMVRAEQTIANEMQGRYGMTLATTHERDSSRSGAPFTFFEMTEEGPGTRQATKAEALAHLDSFSPDWSEDRERRRDSSMSVTSWIGKDPDVDRQIVAKFPGSLSVEERAGINGRTVQQEKAAAEEAEAIRLWGNADRQDQRSDELQVSEAHHPVGEPQRLTTVEVEVVRQDAQAQRGQGEVLYDSAERRRGTAEHLSAQGIDGEVAATRMRADVSHGKPATAAVEPNPSKRAPKAKKGRGSQQVQRTGLTR